MKLQQRFIIFITTVLLFSMVVTSPATADVSFKETTGQVSVDTDDFWVEVSGNANVPVYTFAGVNATNGTQHRVQFVDLFEFKDTNNNTRYDTNDTKVATTMVSLSALDVSLGQVEEDTSSDDVSFNLTLTPSEAGMASFSSLTFENHIRSANQTHLKFDVILEDYTFSNDSHNLALGFQLSSTQSNDTTSEATSSSDTVRFGNDAYLSSLNTAEAGDETIDSALSAAESGENVMVHLSYNNFTGDLVHDPTLGIQPSSSNGDADESSAPLAIGFGLIGLALLPVLRKQTR